ncbi:N-6 DNA methylase [Pseudophaeobacter sp. MA21411-1]|nr:N-6 DNA methylase [Pseudophaeobacter flagellatus]MCD9150077.1 N-6 DNA methylase [Pseudophaeobacter flagellatus]
MKCGRLIREHTGTKRYALFGQEAIGSTWALVKMNLFLHGEENHQIEWGDTIRNPKLRTSDDMLRHFDVVVANPPFSLDKWGTEAAETDKFARFLHRRRVSSCSRSAPECLQGGPNGQRGSLTLPRPC